MTKRKELTRTITDRTQLPGLRAWLETMVGKGLEAGAVMVILTRPRRTKDQNAKLWPMLHDVASQCQLVIDGEAQWASADDWKDVFSAALTHHQRVARGVDGGVVFLGRRTSKMRKREFSDLIELIYAYGAEHGVAWSERSRANFEELRVAA